MKGLIWRLISLHASYKVAGALSEKPMPSRLLTSMAGSSSRTHASAWLAGCVWTFDDLADRAGKGGGKLRHMLELLPVGGQLDSDQH
jgi:hypothetical protein